MKKVVAVMIMALALLAGCGGERVHIKINTVNQKTITAMCDEDYFCKAYTVWYKAPTFTLCNIYLLPEDEYPTEENYAWFLKHEKKHCYEGDFHD